MQLSVDVVILLSGLACLIGEAMSSVGDRSWKFHKCTELCLHKKCIDMNRFNVKQPLHRKVLSWSCEDECKYTCMWRTVDAFKKDGSPVPQFYGKWPFVRLWGIQEPASVVFSILNLLCHFLIFKFRSKVPSSAPMYFVWHGAALVGVNAWFWSVVFHMRDTDFTEKMDYFSAFSIALYSVFGMLCRFLGTEQWWRPVIVGVCAIIAYALHIYYLGWIKFDYSYNMAANVTVGCVVLGGWLTWCIKFRRERPYVWKCVLCLVCMNILLLLELWDFPPLLWVFDAHSLWHAGTSPLGILWYSFITDDCLFLLKQQEQKRQSQSEELNGFKKSV